VDSRSDLSHPRGHSTFALLGIAQAGNMTVCGMLTGADQVIVLAVDDTAHRRRGRKVDGAGWIHDGAMIGRHRVTFGHCWVITGVVVNLPILTRPVCLPVACRRWKGKGSTSATELACQMMTAIAARLLR
jgi:hypothetical protein